VKINKKSKISIPYKNQTIDPIVPITGFHIDCPTEHFSFIIRNIWGTTESGIVMAKTNVNIDIMLINSYLIV